MRSILPFAIIFGIALNSLAHAAPDSPLSLQPAREIRGVWDLGVQPCNGGGANAYARNTSEAEVKLKKQFSLPQLGYRFNVPQLPDVDETVVKVHLGDHSRGVTDHYLLLANQDLEAPFAAIVITELPKGMETRESAFQAARTLQEGLARGIGFSPALSEVNGPYGKSLEMLVPNRVGTQCFPTSKFAIVPPNTGIETIGISRFSFDKNRLLEFSLVLRVRPEMSREQREAFARAVMDGFWLSLNSI